MSKRAQSDPEIFDGLIDDIYAAAENSAVWGSVLKTIDVITNGSCSALLSMKILKGKVCGTNLTSDGHEKRFMEYQEELIFRDNFAGIIKGVGERKIINSADLFGEGGAKTSTVYHEFYEKFRFEHFLGVNLFVSDDAWVGLVTFRGPHLFPHSAIDRQLFERIAPHLRRSMKVSQIAGSRRAETNAALNALEKLHHAAFLLDGHKRVISMNALAQALLGKGEVEIASGGILEIGRGRIHDANENSLLPNGRPINTSATRAPLFRGSRCPAKTVRFNLERQNSGIFPSLTEEAGELVLVFDAEARLASMVGQVRDKFGLTAAEARVYETAMLYSSSGEIAHSLGLSRETIRSHMKHIFLKMDISGHVELLQYSALHSAVQGQIGTS